MTDLVRKTIETPVGTLLLVGTDSALHELLLPPQERLQPSGSSGALDDAAAQLDEYFAGSRIQFDLPLKMHGTAFQRRVWDALTGIGYGETASYADVARAVGIPKGSRAVGQANGRNPISIIVPCHRVIASDGSLGGYGGGLAMKQKLLQLEHSVLSRGPA